MRLFHGSSKEIETIKPSNSHGDPWIPCDYVFATRYFNLAATYAASWSDADISQCYTDDGFVMLVEMRPNAFDECLNKIGYVYEFNTSDFIFNIFSNPINCVEFLIDKEIIYDACTKIINVLKYISNIEKTSLIAFNLDNPMYDWSVDRVYNRLIKMGDFEFDNYIKWLRDSNKILYDKIIKKIED